jgi:hypothetical protein
MCALIGKPVSGGGVCVGGGGRAFHYTYIYSRKRESYEGEGAELVGVLVAETIHPACMCEGGGRGGEGGGRAFYYTYIYSGKRDSCEGVELVGVLVAESIHPACMCEGGGRGGEGGGRAIRHENAVGEWARRRKGE